MITAGPDIRASGGGIRIDHAVGDVGTGSAVTRFRRTYHDVDGQHIEGTWRHIFTRNMNRCS